MKILQLALSLGAGGAERLVLGLCNEHADNTDDEIVLVTLKDNSISKNELFPWLKITLCL